jgi:multidrug resistance protein MdtO
MTALASVKSRQWPFLAFLREELAPRSGRLGAVARIAACCTIVVATGMLYQIPEPAYAAYIVFFLGRGDAAVTVRIGMAGAIGVTLATLLSLFLYSFDAGEPALRLPLLAVSTFLGMFLLRTMAIGPIAFLAGFILVVTQTLIDVIPDLEALTHFVLWLWVVIMLPVVVTVLVNLLTGPSPTQLARRSSLHLLDALTDALGGRERLPLARASADALELAELRQRAELLDRNLRFHAAGDASLIETLEELISLAALVPPGLAPEVRRGLAEACEACRAALLGGLEKPYSTPAGLADASLATLTPVERPVVLAMRQALDRLAIGLSKRLGARSEKAAKHKAALFVPDAFSNPEHARFAIKTTIAAVAAYVIYTGADWPGIRTALITCFFVAQGTLGETLHKLTLRLGGALIGALIGGLCIVYVLPEMTDIGDLSLLIVTVSAVCAWVATSSERLAYAGMQMALAFFLGVLQGYGPSSDLTVLRDRMVGIVLGNVLMSLVFSVIWPTSAATQARKGLAAALRALAALLLDRGPLPGAGRRLAVARGVANARNLISLGAFETGLLPRHPANEAMMPSSLDDLDRIAAAVFVVAEQHTVDAYAEVLDAEDKTIAAWLSASANCLSEGRTLPPAPSAQAAADALAALPVDAGVEIRSAMEARLILVLQFRRFEAHALQ